MNRWQGDPGNTARAVRPWRQALLLAGVVGLAYAGALPNGFVWDDRLQIVANPHLEGAAELPGYFVQFSQSLNFPAPQLTYRPFFLVSLLIDHAAWGLQPFGYHLTNLLLHLINTWLVFRLGSMLAGSPLAGLWAGLLFGLHPVQTEAVDWISGRTEAIAALFVLLAMVCDWQWSRSQGWRAMVWGAATVAATVCALLSKETAIVLPLALLLRAWLTGEGAPRPAALRALLVALPVVVYLLIRLSTMSNMIQSASERDWGGLIVTAAAAMLEYLRLIVWPLNLTAAHDFRFLNPTAGRLLGVIAGSIGAAMALWWLRRWRFVAFGLMWAMAFLLPSFALLLVGRGYLITERSLYVPMAGLAVGGGWLAARALGALRASYRQRGAAAGWAGLAIVLAGMAWAVSTRHQAWHDELSLWIDAVAKAPASGFARHNLAVELDRRGRAAEAVEVLRDGLRQVPDDLEIMVTLGEVSFNLGDVPTAAQLFQSAMRRDDGRPDPIVMARAYYGWGLVQYNQGSGESARRAWEAAIRLNPRHAEAALALKRVVGP
ncbi:MAG: tetratricopeptide repeat protein [Nitrospirota bacterium]